MLRNKRSTERSAADNDVDSDVANRGDVIGDVIGDIFAEGVPIDDVIDQALELLFGGQETLSGLITSLVLLVAKNGGHVIVDKMAAELSHHGLLEGDGEIDMDALDRLEYVDGVVKEGLRLYPPIGGGYRRALCCFEVDVNIVCSLKR